MLLLPAFEQVAPTAAADTLPDRRMWVLIVAFGLLLGLAVYELWVCEGAHLGRRFVVWLYDLAATRYDRIKGFDPDWERRFLGEPLAESLSALLNARLLDVGAGTGRVVRALTPLLGFRGSVVNLEPSRRMLDLGRALTRSTHMPWVRGWAVPLPFAKESFDIVVSLEVLEFTPKPMETLAEIVRVLRPGGWVLVTNRVGTQARWIVGKTFRRRDFPAVLEAQGLRDIAVYPWQVDYDLAWARKSDIDG